MLGNIRKKLIKQIIFSAIIPKKADNVAVILAYLSSSKGQKRQRWQEEWSFIWWLYGKWRIRRHNKLLHFGNLSYMINKLKRIFISFGEVPLVEKNVSAILHLLRFSLDATLYSKKKAKKNIIQMLRFTWCPQHI